MGFERTLEWNGETLRIVEWSKRTGIPFKVLVARLNKGWDAERALTQGVRGWQKEEAAEEYEADDGRGHKACMLDVEWGDQGGIL